MPQSSSPIYLDYNATAPLLPQLREVMDEYAMLPLNPSSVHYYGRQAKKLLENARKQLANYLSVWPDEIVFTASATEANNLALQGISGRVLAVAATEHSSVLNPAKLHHPHIILPVNSEGLIEIDELEKALKAHQGNLQVSVMLANNETGVIQPIAEISKLVHTYGGIIHCDAVQAFGKIPLDFNLLGVDMLTVSAHKAGGPVGVGALVVRNNLHLQPILLGGGQEKRRRASTENVAAIAGMGKLVEVLPNLSPLQQWVSLIEDKLTEIAPDIVIVGKNMKRIPNTLCLIMPGVSSETQLISLDLAGICVSAGSACSSGRIEPSHVLHAMGIAPEDANSAIRVSLGWKTTEMEINQFIQCWAEIYKRLSQKNAA